MTTPKGDGFKDYNKAISQQNDYDLLKTNSRKIDSLQAIRAIAAAFVMFFHGTAIIQTDLGYRFLDNIFTPGFCGVDIFFVLSGFVIFYTTAGKNYTPRYFLEKRIIRIFPIYWLITVLLVAVHFIEPSPGQDYKGNLETIFKSLILFPQEDPVIGVAWTLSDEMFFYLIFALSFLKKPISLLWIFVCWIAIILFLQISGLHSTNYIVTSLVDPVIINFAMGCVIAWLYRKYPNFNYYRLFIIAGMLLFVFSWWSFYYLNVISIYKHISSGGYNRVILFGIPTAIFIFGILYSRISVNKLLVFLGDASYSLYLIHGTIIAGLIKVISKLHLANYFANFVGAISIFAATLAIASCFYLFIEKPMLKILNKLLLKRNSNEAISVKTIS